MKKTNWISTDEKFWELIFGVVEGVIVWRFSGFQGMCVPFHISMFTMDCWAWSLIQWVIAMVITYYIIIRGSFWLFPRIISYFKILKSNHLRLYASSFHNNKIALNFIYTEWRYLFRRSEVYISIPSIVQPNQGNEFLVWEDNPDQPRIRRLKFYKLNFLTFDIDDKFWVGEDSGNKIGFSPGNVYRFDIFVVVNVSGKSIGESPNKTLSVIVNYKEKHRISIKIVERKDAYKIFRQEKYPRIATKE